MSVCEWQDYEGEMIVLHREFLEACLEERLSQEDPTVLDPRQREFLEVVAASATFSDVIVVPEELLKAFLAGQGDEAASRNGHSSKRRPSLPS